MSYQATLAEILQHAIRRHPDLAAALPPPHIPLTEQTSITFTGDFQSSPLARAVHQAFFAALGLQHKLPVEIVTMPGMSGKKYRYFINNLIAAIDNPRYLEIGSWAGSTACAALHSNDLTAVCIDDWSGFGGPKEAFLKNVRNSKTQRTHLKVIESDFRKVDYKSLTLDANVYLFDGPHEEQDQYDGIAYALPCLNSNFTLIVDDYNRKSVRSGTQRAIKTHALTIHSSIVIRTTTNDSDPFLSWQNSEWHNGYFIAVAEQPSQA